MLKENDKGEKTLLSGKQINGHYIVISSVRLKNGELKLKTMYKENGKLENDKAFKSVKLPSETPSVLRGQSLTTDLDGYPSHADESIAQNAKSESEKEVLERQIPFIEAEIQKYEAKIASLDERIKKTQTRIQPYLDEINALQKQYDELYFTETRGEEANAKKWLKLEEIKAKQEELRKPYNDALFKFVFPHQRLKGKVQTEIQKLKFGLQDRALRLEEIQNEALNTSKAQKAWLEAFNLKSLEEAYIPNFKAEVKEAINRVLGGEEIKLTKGSFEKLLKRDREEFLPYIKDTLEKADLIIKDKENALIFVKDIGKKSYFTSVAKNANNEWVISTNSLKTLNTLKNRVDDNGEVLYLSKEAPNILAEAFTKRAFSNELAKDIIPQKANLEAVNKQKDKEFLEAYEKADFKGKVELAKQDINEEIKFLEKQKEEFERITQQKDYNDIELEQARKILENAKEEVEGHYRIKYMQNGKEMRAYISKTDYFNEGKILSKDEILHKIIQKTIYKDKIENIKKTSDKLKKQIKIIDEYLKEYGDNEAGAISDDIIEKFKYYNFAKDTGKGEIIIGERRKGLYEQAQKVLNSRFLKAKKRATQSKKNYNITYDEARKLFYKGDMSEEQKELFQSVLPIAQKLNVRIRTAIREPYEDMIKDTTNIAGMYRYELNTATLKKGGNRTDTQRAETLLHELIHSVTSRAMSLYKTPLRDKMLSKTQIKAIDEIDQIYKKLYKFKKTFKLQDENGADLYGIKNSHEMLAKLANPMFSSKLKEIGLYEKLVNNIMKIILSVRDFIRLRSDKNVYEKLKQCLKDIIENYKDDFTQEYEKQNIRDFTLTSQTQKEQIYTQRQELKSTLKAKINQAITNENTGEKAILTNKGISKMLSDKAISKSVDNGFSREEHLRAVGVVDELFKRAKRAFSKRDEKDKNLSIYRYNAPFKNANALMTLKDYQQNEAARSKEMGVIGNYNILSNLKGVSENELYEPFLEKVGGYLSKADFYERHLPFAREEFQKL
ncbi:PBECR2 nuclease fold domain-containing protein, partial [Campylobacter upsaliensis]